MIKISLDEPFLMEVTWEDRVFVFQGDSALKTFIASLQELYPE